MWHTHTGNQVARLEFPSYVESIHFSPDSHQLLVSTSDGTTIFDTTTWTQIRQVKHAYEDLSPNGEWVIASEKYGAEIWNLATGETIGRLEYIPGGDDYAFQTFEAFFSPNGKWAVIRSRDSIVRIWDVATWKQVASLQHKDLGSVSFSPDSQLLATTDDRVVRLWKTDTWTEIHQLEHDDHVDFADFFGLGTELITSSGRTVRIWVDPQDFLRNLCTYLPRNLTLDEWQLYFPGEPYHKTCPQLPQGSTTSLSPMSLPAATLTSQPIASPLPAPPHRNYRG